MNPNVAELARLSSYALVKRWSYDWAPIEADLGFRFPSEYKEYVSYFPPGSHGGVIDPVHPGLREGGLTLPGRIRLLAELFRDEATSASGSMPFYPDPGGLIPWADHQGNSALCWLPDGEDPDAWPVYAVNDANAHELLPGSTIEALIAVLRSEAGRSVFFGTFYQDLELCGDPFTFTGDEGSPLVALPEPEQLDQPPAS